MNQYSIKKDKYKSSREGDSHLFNLFCSKCGEFFALYQKDGEGALVRLYLDRIIAPSELSRLQLKVNDKAEMPNLKCSNCSTLIGIPMLYKKEKRLAFKLIPGLFMKRRSSGIYLDDGVIKRVQ